ncbi:hypothetical protein [Propionicicella superfundia]|uniref:hypothetical protein n=1 Tax=Propionicicella superfundia TaxID=348582 RepID=UPI00041A06CE|nr:hypothetical protein [Propionicicella superfundia]
MTEKPVVNPNYGGNDEPQPENDPLVNPNMGGEQAYDAEDIDSSGDPEVNPNFGGGDRPRPPKQD